MKTIQIRGTDVPLDLRTWTPNLRHFGSVVVMAAAALLLAVGLLVQFLAPAASAIVLYALLALLVVLLAFEAALVVLGMQAETAAPAASRPASGPSAAPLPAPARTGFERPDGNGSSEPDDDASEDTVLTLKCGRCATEFDVTDTGERPLYHNCPGCGAEGVLRGESAAPKPAQEAKAEPAPKPAPAPEPDGEAAGGFARPASAAPGEEAAKEPSPKKRLKLRCGGCKGIFQVEDNGKRPLRHRCPHCNRLGEIK